MGELGLLCWRWRHGCGCNGRKCHTGSGIDSSVPRGCPTGQYSSQTRCCNVLPHSIYNVNDGLKYFLPSLFITHIYRRAIFFYLARFLMEFAQISLWGWMGTTEMGQTFVKRNPVLNTRLKRHVMT